MHNDTASMDLEFMSDDTLSGFRLMRLEVFNWGTFDQRVEHAAGRPQRAADGRHRLRKIDPGGRGDHAAGAGQPHRLQQGGRRRQQGALAALLCAGQLQVRAQRGHRRGQAGQPARPQQLFGNPGRVPQRRLQPDRDPGAGVLDEAQGQPARFFVGAERDLSIAADFSKFGTDIAQLRKKQRALFDDLRDNRIQPRLRLEQERIGYGWLEQALRAA